MKTNSSCCRKTAVCIGDQLLDFSLPELVRSQSTFITDPEVLQNCTSFTLWMSAGLAVGEFSAVMGLTPCMLCVHINCMLCVLGYYLMISQLWIQDWVGLCSGNHCICWVLLDYYIDNPKVAHSVKNWPNISSFKSSKPRQHSIVFRNVPDKFLFLIIIHLTNSPYNFSIQNWPQNIDRVQFWLDWIPNSWFSTS